MLHVTSSGCIIIIIRCAGEPDSKTYNTRAKHWLTGTDDHTCKGTWIREVCNVASGDLPWIIASPQMFLNKIRLEECPTAFRCLELWYRDRVRHLANHFTSSSSSSLTDLGYRFNLTHFSQQPFVQQRRLISTRLTSRQLTPVFTTPLR